MIVGVPRESFPGERRVALIPAAIPNLTKAGLDVVVEAGAGVEAGYPDADYVAKGGKIIAERSEVFRGADVIVQVLCYGSNDRTGKEDVPLFHSEQVLIGFLRPLGSLEPIQEIAKKGVTSFSVELMPRTTRAQSMDALSSMATICGYKAIVLAADTLPRIFPMLTTAAGTITPGREWRPRLKKEIPVHRKAGRGRGYAREAIGHCRNRSPAIPWLRRKSAGVWCL